MSRRVVVTGLGVVSPVGVGVDSFWSAIVAGRSGIGRITRFDPSPFPSQIAGEVSGFEAADHVPRRDVVRTDRFIHFAIAAAREALADSSLSPGDITERAGVSIGTGMGGVPLLVDAYDVFKSKGAASMSPYAMPGFLPNMAAGWVSMSIGARGPIACPTTACAAGTQAIGDAFRMVQRGDADIMFAGGTDALIHPVILGSFCALRALSTRNGEPTRASRPFDRERDGFVLSEGAGVVVLEELGSARARGARVYAEVVGYGLTADAKHPTAPSADGPTRAMRIALSESKLSPSDVDYVNAHGTSTSHNDANETSAIQEVFAGRATRVPVSSTKSMTGHMIGAAGAVEAIVCALAITRGVIPPTINYEAIDPACDLDCVPNVARPSDVRVAMSNSFAFGGTNAILILRRIGASAAERA